jgi:predicted AAA+ superfamily ATPase
MAKTMNKLLSALAPWNAWDSPSPRTGIPRDITPTLLPLIQRPEALVLTGIRRGGKSTIMFQLVEALVAKGTDRTSILYVNFDEPAIEPSRGTALLEEIYQAFRERLCPRGRAIVFLDEVQHVPEWERWVNGRLVTENISIVVSGSSAQLMSREIATLLTGRNITVRIFPLSFSEYIRFKGVDISMENRLLLEKQRHVLRHELHNFLQWGCFPEVTLEQSDEVRARLLSQYLDDILFKDVVMRIAIAAKNVWHLA